MFKRMISLLLAVAMVISMVPATGFAVETEPEETAQETTAPETVATEPAVTDVPTEEQTTVPTESEVPTEPETRPATEPAETEPSESVPETEPEETVEETVAEEAAATLIVSGYCGKGGLRPGENLQFAFYSDGALYITGYGEMKDYATILDIPPWAKTWTNDYPQVTSVSLPEGLVNIGNCAFYGSAFTSVEIPSTVTKIGINAFYSNGNLQKVTMPDCVTSIGEYAFDLCRSLVEINWPSSLVEIGNAAFHNCDSLKKADIPNVTNLGEWVFAMCEALEECNLSENLTYIPEYAFYGCDALKGIHIPDEVLGIGESAFYGSGLEEITVPGSVLQLGNSVFCGCSALQTANLSGNLTELPNSLFYNCRSLEKVFLKTQPLNPDNPEERVIKTIGSQAFRGCTALKEFTLPETVTSIGNSAFYSCRSLPGINFLYNDELTIGDYAFHDCDSLNIVVIPNEVTSLGQNAFSYCDELERVSVGENIRNLPACLFQGCKKLIQADVSKELKSIGAGVFNGCESLTDIKLPDTLEEIGANAFKGCKSLSNVPLLSVKTFGNSAFEDCDSFTEVTLPLRRECSLGSNIFQDCDNLKTVRFAVVDPGYKGPLTLEYIPSYMFSGCIKLESINMEGTVGIGKHAFSDCDALKFTELSDSLREIGDYAFSSCDGFTEMTIPNGITQYGDHIFYHCGNLKKVNLPADMKVLPAYMFYWCDALEDIELHEGLVEIQNYAFSSCDSLKNLNFPSSLTTLGNNVYSCCEGLEIVSIPQTIVNFGSGIFSECMNLSAVHLVGGDRGITALPEKMLENCTALEEITLPNSLTSIGDGVFSGCKNLKEVEIYSNKLETIGSNAFYKCQSLTELTLPDSVHTIGAYAFFNCQSLTELTLPDSVHTIGAYAFSNCYNLQKFELPHNLTAISKGLFSGNRNMQYVIIPVAVKEIGDYAFSSCEAFTDVYYMGSGFEWQLITKSETGNVPLHNAEVHYNGVKDSGELEGGLEWKLDFYNTLTIFGKGDMPDYSGVGQAPWYEHREDIEKVTIRQGVTRIGEYCFAVLDFMHTITIPASMKSIGANAFLGCAALKKIQYMGTSKEWYAMDIDPEGNEMLEAAALKCILLVDHTVENQQIRIHRSGNATAWYRTTPNVKIGYTLAGDTDLQPTGPATSGPEGVFDVPLGHFGTPGTYEVIVKVHSIGEVSFDPAIEMVANIQVTDLEFFQSWELKMEAKGSAGISKGVGGEIGALEAKAELAAIKGTANVGSVMNVTRNYSGGKNSLKVTSDRNMGIGVEVGSGIYAEAGGAKLDIARANLGVSGSAVESYGIRIDDFNYSPDQLKALGIYFLGESLVANPCSTYYVPLYRYLTDKYAYDKLGCTVISGFGTKVVGSASAGLGQIKVNDNALFSGVTAVKGDFKATVSQMMKYSSTGEYEKTTSVQLTDSLAALTASGGIPSELKKNLLGKDIQVKATSSAGGKSLAIKSLVEREGAWDWNFSPKVEKTAEYISAVITDDSADGPMSQSPAFKHYLYDPSMFLSTLDMVQMAIAMAEWKLPTQYREETQHQTLSTIPDIAIGASLGLSGKLAVTLSYMEKNGYTTGYGYNGVVTGKSDEDTIEIEMRDKIFQIDKFIDECAIPALVEDASKLYNTVVGIIKITIEAGKALIKGIQDSIYNWAVSLTVPNSGFTGSYSCQVKAIQQTSQMTANGISSVAGYNFDTVATIGDTILVAVQDLDTGMDVTDLSAEPLTLVLRYDEADLEAAGLTKDSAVVLDGSIAIYRYSDEGDFFEFVGGENDLAAMTVTTQIVKPGQYVLAADSCAPQLSSLNLSDFREMPTITARIDDLSGLDVSKFVFKLDGAVKVDSSNVSQYLNSNTGLFTYAVTEALSEGEHSMSFTLADTTGNTQTYEYSFRIDLTAPVITETSITGATNENALVEVRAKISDENLEAVYAVFSKRNGDGTWSAEASAEMAQLEDGTWALDYVGDGSTVKVYIQAMDIAGNTAQSDAVEVHPFIESVQIEAEYIVLRENQSHTLSAVTAPDEFASQVAWTTVDASIAVIDEYGVLTGKKEGTTYAIATVFDGNKRCSARVRVDVTEALDIEGVQLSTAKATTELYKTEYTTLDILLKLPQNFSAQAAGADQEPVNNGVAIESAQFTDKAMAEYFDLAVLDDRTVQIVPTAEALANAKAVKSSYKGTVTVIVDGEAYETEVLALSVKKTMPKLKASVAAFNSFYAGQSQPIVITGATVTNIALDSNKTQPEWLTLKDGCLVLNEKAPVKSVSGKVNLLVETAEWAVPAALTVSVKNTYKVPGVKLAATSVTVSNQPGPAAVELKLVPTNKADTISGIGISDITAPEGYTVENFNAETGTFTLKTADGFKAGTIELKVVFGNVINTLKLTIKTQAVKLKLSASKVSLNKDLGDVATVAVNCLTAGYDVTAPVLTYDAEMLDVQYSDGKLTISAKAAVYGKTYPVTVSAYAGAPAVKLTVAILKQNVAVKSTIKATDLIDVIRDSSAITVTPSYTNVLNVDVDKAAVLKIYSSADKFKVAIAEVKAEDGIFTVDKAVISDQTLKYKAQLETVIGGTIVKSSMISLTVKMGTAKLTVKTADTTLFAKDKNDRAMFWFEAADATLNGIARVEFKNAKQAAMFELIDYGDGTYAIGFKDGKVDKSLVGKSVTVSLNVFLEGNQTAKANATANVKLTIVK